MVDQLPLFPQEPIPPSAEPEAVAANSELAIKTEPEVGTLALRAAHPEIPDNVWDMIDENRRLLPTPAAGFDKFQAYQRQRYGRPEDQWRAPLNQPALGPAPESSRMTLLSTARQQTSTHETKEVVDKAALFHEADVVDISAQEAALSELSGVRQAGPRASDQSRILSLAGTDKAEVRLGRQTVIVDKKLAKAAAQALDRGAKAADVKKAVSNQKTRDPKNPAPKDLSKEVHSGKHPQANQPDLFDTLGN